MKKINKITSLITVAVLSFVLGLTPVMAETTDADTPQAANYATVKWDRAIGKAGWTSAPTPPLIAGGYAYVASGSRLYKLDCNDGTIEGTASLSGSPGYAMHKPAASDEGAYVYVFEKRGSSSFVEKVKTSDMEIVWKSAEAFPGQNDTPLIYKNGYLYAGTWTGGGTGTYFCIDAVSGATVWKKTSPGSSDRTKRINGYYWSGAYITKDYAVFGTDSAAKTKMSKLYSVNDQSGKDIASKAIKGGIKSLIQYCDGNIVFTTDSGYICMVPVDSEGTLGTPRYYSLGSASTNTPVIENGNIYVGNDAGDIMAFSLEGMKKLWTVKAPGQVKGEMLLSTEGGNGLCLYATYNAKPGGVFYIKLSGSGSKVSESGNLFTPPHKQYCISPLTADENGIIYYKNDSGYIFALKSGYSTDQTPIISAVSSGYDSVTLKLSADNIEKYIIERSSDGENFSVIASSTKGSYKDTKLSTGSKYYYRVKALCGGDSYTGYSKIAEASPALSAPKISAKAGKSRITVTIKKVEGASGYMIYRSDKKASGYKLIGTQIKTIYANRGLKRGHIYYYRVKAFSNAAGGKTYSPLSAVSYKKTK